jgi:hypothetical protein
LYSTVTIGTKKKGHDKTNDCIFKIGRSRFSVPVYNVSHNSVIERHLTEKIVVASPEYYCFLHLNITGFYTRILLVSTPEYYWFLHLNITGFYTRTLLVSTPLYKPGV